MVRRMLTTPIGGHYRFAFQEGHIDVHVVTAEGTRTETSLRSVGQPLDSKFLNDHYLHPYPKKIPRFA